MQEICNLKANHITFHDLVINSTSLMVLAGLRNSNNRNAWISILETKEPEGVEPVNI